MSEQRTKARQLRPDAPSVTKPSQESSQLNDNTLAAVATPGELQGLFWMLRAPDLEEVPPAMERILARRRAAVEASDNPIVQAAHSIIRGAPAGDLALEGALLLAEANKYAPPDHLQKLATKAPAKELLEQATGKNAVMVMPSLDPGTGEWPTKPEHRGHDGEHGAVITIRAGKTTVTQMINPSWRDDGVHSPCPRCMYERTVRIGKQVLFEIARVGELFYAELPDETAFKQFRNRIKKREQRGGPVAIYRAIPQEGGAYFVIHNQQEHEGGEPVPTDREKLFYLLRYRVCSVPEGKLISSSRGWGGPWQGTQGDGRVKQAEQDGEDVGPCAQLWTGSSLKDVAAALGVETRDGQKNATARLHARDCFQRLIDANIKLWQRDIKGGAANVVPISDLLGEDVQHLIQGLKQDEPLCKLLDSEPAQAPEVAPSPLSQALFGGGP